MVEKSHDAGFWPSVYDPFRNLGARLADWITPASEASTDETAYRISMELPGVQDGDIDLTVEDGVVSVRGEKKSEREDKGDTWDFRERQFGSFQRSFRLPADADAEAVSADLKDGVLIITVPKQAPAEPKAKKVTVKKG